MYRYGVDVKVHGDAEAYVDVEVDLEANVDVETDVVLGVDSDAQLVLLHSGPYLGTKNTRGGSAESCKGLRS